MKAHNVKHKIEQYNQVDLTKIRKDLLKRRGKL